MDNILAPLIYFAIGCFIVGAAMGSMDDYEDVNIGAMFFVAVLWPPFLIMWIGVVIIKSLR